MENKITRKLMEQFIASASPSKMLNYF